jgi:hypothetical protein
MGRSLSQKVTKPTKEETSEVLNTKDAEIAKEETAEPGMLNCGMTRSTRKKETTKQKTLSPRRGPGDRMFPWLPE